MLKKWPLLKKTAMDKAAETILEVNLKALEHNYRFLKSRLNAGTKFMGVVKAFAYGSDSVRIAQKLVDLGIDYFAVAYVNEGIALRQAGIQTPILVLHPQKINFVALIENNLEPSIYSFKVLNDFLEVASELGQTNYPIHLKFNTGLNRLGFAESDIDRVLRQLTIRKEIKVVSVFSHLAASEDKTEKAFTLRQLKSFESIIGQIDVGLGYEPLKHLLNTSGIINYPEAQHHMVRSGIGLYGFGNEAEIDAQLRPIASLKTIISQIHAVAPNESVGYNRAFSANGHRMTATLPLGHADGIGRQYGNGKAYVTIRGRKAPIIGNVCMDMIMVDITGIDCEEGDEVLVFGQDPTAENFASGAQTITYELLTGISRRVKRTFIDS